MSKDQKEEEVDQTIKAILVGESGVGKTCLINVCVGNPFDANEKVTYANSFIEKKYKIDSEEYVLQLNGYKNFIENTYNKTTNIYLYSIKKDIFKKI